MLDGAELMKLNKEIDFLTERFAEIIELARKSKNYNLSVHLNYWLNDLNEDSNFNHNKLCEELNIK